MPVYVYACNTCTDLREVKQSFADAPLTRCSACGGSLHRVPQRTSIAFKGSGWYATDAPGARNPAA